MKQVTPDVVEQADRNAAEAVRQARQKARSEGRELGPEYAFYIHKAAWAATTGAEQVQVVLPARSCFGRTGASTEAPR